MISEIMEKSREQSFALYSLNSNPHVLEGVNPLQELEFYFMTLTVLVVPSV